MPITSTARRAPTVLTVAAGAALLSASACSTSAGADGEGSAGTPSETSDQGEGQGAGQNSSDGGGAATGDEQGDGDSDEGSEQNDGLDAGDEDEATEPTEPETRLVLVTDLGPEEPGEGDLVRSPDQLAALLTGPLGGMAECDSELTLSPGATASCMGPASVDSPDPDQEWTAHSVRIPSEEDFTAGSRVAILFTTGGALTGPAEVLLEETVSLTGLGVSSTFGAEDLDSEQLAQYTLEVLTSPNAYVPVDYADWEDVTCQDGLSFATFEPVACTATTAGGDQWELEVAPGAFAGNDQGLLVGIETL
ncbi:hypothetical protein [Brachybacterium sp. GCM10030252]|uniref:hypothetical protein n=1 Tax=Brachybacterium sp. GCM10030252 TaxID=3273380 RepID=UPI00361D41DD